MPYLFLSYAKTDRDTAFAMRDVLRKEGFLVWMDENENGLEEHHWSGIEKNIRNAGAFVLLVSSAAKQSKWVKRELDFAEKSQKIIIPILIQGEAWSRLGMEAIPLGLGTRLDIPDEKTAEIKNLLKGQPDSPLPQPLPDDKLQAQRQRSFLIKFVLILLVVIGAIRLAINYRPSSIEPTERATNTAVSDLYDSLVLTAIQTDQIASEAAATERAVRATASHVAVWNDIGTQAALSLEATQTYESGIQLTALAGNGVLPCEAQIRAEEGSFSIRIYVQPALASHSWIRDETIFSNTRVIITEWIVNGDGVWYRIGTESYNNNYGYVLGEDLLLDENCPR